MVELKSLKRTPNGEKEKKTMELEKEVLKQAFNNAEPHLTDILLELVVHNHAVSHLLDNIRRGGGANVFWDYSLQEKRWLTKSTIIMYQDKLIADIVELVEPRMEIIKEVCELHNLFTNKASLKCAHREIYLNFEHEFDFDTVKSTLNLDNAKPRTHKGNKSWEGIWLAKENGYDTGFIDYTDPETEQEYQVHYMASQTLHHTEVSRLVYNIIKKEVANIQKRELAFAYFGFTL